MPSSVRSLQDQLKKREIFVSDATASAAVLVIEKSVDEILVARLIDSDNAEGWQKDRKGES